MFRPGAEKEDPRADGPRVLLFWVIVPPCIRRGIGPRRGGGGPFLFSPGRKESPGGRFQPFPAGPYPALEKRYTVRWW